MSRRRRSVEEDENGIVTGPYEGDLPPDASKPAGWKGATISFDDSEVGEDEIDKYLANAFP